MLCIRRTNKIIRKLTHRNFTNCKEKSEKRQQEQCRQKNNNKSNASATGTEQIVDFLYAILSFYSSERQQSNKKKQTSEIFQKSTSKTVNFLVRNKIIALNFTIRLKLNLFSPLSVKLLV